MSNIAYQLRRLLDSTARDETLQHQLSGRLSRRYSAIARGDEDVFTRKLEQDGIESAVFIAIDESGSMDESMKVTGGYNKKCNVAADAAIALSDALRRCHGTKYMISKFSDYNQKCGSPQVYSGTTSDVTGVRTVWRTFKRWNEQHGKLVGRDTKLRDTDGGTPDLAALQDALTLLANRPEPRKVLLFIGDGDGYNAEAAQALQAKFPDVITIGICLAASPRSTLVFNQAFKYALPITCADDLGGTAMAAIIRAITR